MALDARAQYQLDLVNECHKQLAKSSEERAKDEHLLIMMLYERLSSICISAMQNPKITEDYTKALEKLIDLTLKMKDLKNV